MTDFRELACELLAALAWVNKHHPLPPDLKFNELEQRAAAAVKAPEEPKLPLIPAAEFQKPAVQQKPQYEHTMSGYGALSPPDASPLVKYQRRINDARRQAAQQSPRLPGAHWY